MYWANDSWAREGLARGLPRQRGEAPLAYSSYLSDDLLFYIGPDIFIHTVELPRFGNGRDARDALIYPTDHGYKRTYAATSER